MPNTLDATLAAAQRASEMRGITTLEIYQARALDIAGWDNFIYAPTLASIERYQYIGTFRNGTFSPTPLYANQKAAKHA